MDYKAISSTSKPPCQLKHEQDLQHYLISLNKKGNKMETFNDVDYWFNYEQGKAVLEKRKPSISVPMYKLLKLIVDNLQYRNIMIMNIQDTAKCLKVSDKHLKETLSKLSDDFIKCQSSRDGMYKGQFKILVNPSYGFKYPPNSLDSARSRAVRTWLKG